MIAVKSYASGAGGCADGMVAVGPFHSLSTKTVVLTSLSEKRVSVTAKEPFSGKSIPLAYSNGSNGPPTILFTGVKYTIEVKDQREDMRGVLLRLEDKASPKKDLTGRFNPGFNSKIENACLPPVVGLTHTNNTNKARVNGTLEMDTASELFLDVSVVFVMNDTDGIHSYDRFSIVFQAPTKAPTKVPTNAPILAPVTSSVEDECKGFILFRLICLFLSIFR